MTCTDKLSVQAMYKFRSEWRNVRDDIRLYKRGLPNLAHCLLRQCCRYTSNYYGLIAISTVCFSIKFRPTNSGSTNGSAKIEGYNRNKYRFKFRIGIILWESGKRDHPVWTSVPLHVYMHRPQTKN